MTAGFEAPVTGDRRGGRRGYAVPLVIAVTGHRDLRPDEIPRLRKLVRDFLGATRDAYPGRVVAVMSALAEGADRLVAEEAITLRLPLHVPLPMPRDLYVQDFATEQSRAQFDALCRAAAEIYELPITPGNTSASVADPGPNRERQYAQAGVFLCAHCHILLALWDGKDGDGLGGTAQVVRFHHTDYMPGYTPRTAAGRLTLADDESDLVYHVVCSRDRPDGAPAEGLAPFETSWYTTDEDRPRSDRLPDRHARIFERANEFSRDAQAHAETIDRERYSLLELEQAARLAPGLLDINQVFCAADWLAIRYQKRVQLTVRVMHVSALLTGFAYISYTDLRRTGLLIMMILGLMGAAAGLSFFANRGAWHRKYLDYRTLAEGLRVQFYWAAAGVTSGNVSKFAHDNFLQMQDPDLGWIRNVMRVAGIECDAAPQRTTEGLEFAIREWIGDDGSGQLGYYRRKTTERLVRQATTRRIARLGLVATALALLILLFVGSWIPEDVASPVVYLMGCVLLMVGVRQSYASSTAESEVIKQYEFMRRTFHNARRRIDAAEADGDRRHVLKLLGDAALEEHAEWILMHRERAIDEHEAARIG
ncbi:MAG: hypothetical protein EHM60_10400 [Lysobacterales bacterium]|nr:MAG: hypothetical protein EHM60_10400 [Xanthomonadales bacterium]